MIDGHSRRDPTTDRVECTGSKVVHLTPHDDESMALYTVAYYILSCVRGWSCLFSFLHFISHETIK